jgi:hypothetical protein
VNWIFALALTFVVGTAAAVTCFRLQNDPAVHFDTLDENAALRDAKRINVGLRALDISLGDSFDHVDKLVALNPDPNGPNQNIDWSKDRLTDYFSISRPSISIDRNNRLNPAVFFSFNDRKRLESSTIRWTHEGERSNHSKRKIIDALIEGELAGLDEKDIDLKQTHYSKKSETDDYIQEFAIDFSEKASHWSVTYSISIK